MAVDIGIDLGTASVLVYVKGKGVVLKEPSVVAFDRDTNVIRAIGEEARLMLGRTPGNIVAVRPLRQGVISDYTVTEKMIQYFVRKAIGKRTFKKPRISICVPSGVTEVEKRAVEEAAFAAGAREVHLIEEPVAAAIGAGIDIGKPCGNMIVEIGGGTADIAVISLGGAVVHTSIKIAGDDFDEAIVRYMRKKHNLLIGERTAEDDRASKDGNSDFLGDRRSTSRDIREDCGSGCFGIGTDSAGAVCRHSGSGDCSDWRWGNAARSGRADRGKDRYQYNDGRRSDESSSDRNRTVCGIYEWQEGFLRRNQDGTGCFGNRMKILYVGGVCLLL